MVYVYIVYAVATVGMSVIKVLRLTLETDSHYNYSVCCTGKTVSTLTSIVVLQVVAPIWTIMEVALPWALLPL